MNDRDELSQHARALIAIGRAGDEPSAADRARVRAKLLAGIAGTAAAMTAAKTSAAAQLGTGAAGGGAGATAGASGVLSAKLAGGVLAVALATAGAGAVVLHVAQRSPAAERPGVAGVAGAPRAQTPVAQTAPEPAATRSAAVPGLGPNAPAALPAAEPSPIPAATRVNAPAGDRERAASAEEPAAAAPTALAVSPELVENQRAQSAAPVARPLRARSRARRPAAAVERSTTVASSSAPTQNAAAPPASGGAANDVSEQAEVSPSLRRELTLIAAAQAALARNAPDEALRWLDAHAAGYASGALVQERMAARAVALCALGRNAEGRRAAAELARLAPHSPLLGRARRACAADGP